jgi:hypothetical protein
MNVLWSYFWPCFAAGLLVGGLTGTVAYRRPARRNAAMALGIVLAFALAALWHGPLGAAESLSTRLEKEAQRVLAANDAPAGIAAHIQHRPLTRHLVLSGSADDFQRGEAARLLEQIPGVSDADWKSTSGVPLLAEGLATALVGFLFGLLLAYLVELRRRHKAEWSW